MKKVIYLNLVLIFLISFSCKQEKKQDLILLDKKAFETVINDKQTSLYTLKSENGLIVQVTNFGLRIISVFIPDRDGIYEDINIGYENIDRYINNNKMRFMGAVIGRYANRIANGKFSLNGIEYQLTQNNNGNCLHGGQKGLDMVVWDVDSISDNFIQFSYTSLDGDEGFPGSVKIEVNYTLTSENELKITYKGTTNTPTILNLSNHAFFNLKGEGNGTITDHILTINASHYTPVDSLMIPTGEIVSVENTPFDFQKPTPINNHIDDVNTQIEYGKGYDHNWVLNKSATDTVNLAVTLYEPISGRLLEVYTDQPGIQVFSGNSFSGEVSGKYGKPIKCREGIALETQKFPDSPNHPEFPSTILLPGYTYTQTSIYKFSTK